MCLSGVNRAKNYGQSCICLALALNLENYLVIYGYSLANQLRRA